MTKKITIGLRLSVYLLIAACSQPILESYGCACASRSYTAEEIDGYRELAAKDHLGGLAQMEEYYRWRKWEHETGSAPYEREAKQEQAYLDRRLALRDPQAIEGVVDGLLGEATRRRTKSLDRIRALERARSLILSHPRGFTYIDVWDADRPAIDPMLFAERELGLVKRLGDSYFETRLADEERQEREAK